MRKKISFVFFCLAFSLVCLQLMSNLMELTHEKSQNQILHSITSKVEKAPVAVETKKNLDFKKMAEEMSQEKY